MATATIDELSDANFDTEVLKADRPTLVEFWAPWSSACERAEAGLEAVAADFEETVRTVRINVDDNPQTASNFSVTNLPSYVLFADGQTVARVTGSASKRTLRQLFEQAAG
ncbi:thioredoxin [Persicimonas caeni]|jgi:thioredoxin 1|uniref:Thioredoxin n=1 Tax=Persicimonas caeni TaxID=2292766 RepID=A0A4Y6Q1B5_PERCE|nr:thioredoxin domain-containing protein [Persicimonas caeni]QDG54374.1 thioredoxin [Persicimonas caeni]QED35595.1 thioredoxin [Persicimonas caeni]